MGETKGFTNPETNHQNVHASDGVRGKFDFNGFTSFRGEQQTEVKSEVLGNEIRRVMEEAGNRGPDNTGINKPSQNPFQAPLGGIPLD